MHASALSPAGISSTKASGGANSTPVAWGAGKVGGSPYHRQFHAHKPEATNKNVGTSTVSNIKKTQNQLPHQKQTG